MKKRILFIVQLPPPVHGASVINQMIVEAENILSSYTTSVLPLKFVTDISQIRRTSVRKIFLMIGFIFRLVYCLVSFRPHLVYFTISPKGNSFYRDALFAIIIKLFGKKIVYHLHSRGIQQGMKGKWKKVIYKFVFRNSYVISLSGLLNEEFTGLPVKKIFNLPNGIPAMEYDFSIRHQKPTAILFLSNLFRAKGTIIFLEIIRSLVSRGYSFEASLAGADGDLSAGDVQKFIDDHQLNEYVSVPGPLYGIEKQQALEKATIFCMPSLDEAFPLVILEAMQASMCIVASRVGAVPEIIDDGQTGFLCTPGNVGEFTEKIARLLSDAALKNRITETARVQFLQNYTQAAFEERLKGIIDELAT